MSIHSGSYTPHTAVDTLQVTTYCVVLMQSILLAPNMLQYKSTDVLYLPSQHVYGLKPGKVYTEETLLPQTTQRVGASIVLSWCTVLCDISREQIC